MLFGEKSVEWLILANYYVEGIFRHPSRRRIAAGHFELLSESINKALYGRRFFPSRRRRNRLSRNQEKRTEVVIPVSLFSDGCFVVRNENILWRVPDLTLFVAGCGIIASALWVDGTPIKFAWYMRKLFVNVWLSGERKSANICM